ncbi:hypothetical protein PPACK8108_LOCUS5808 [Phakopsora pachyrhizi]|uniref:Uncharacterized protein n=1 Tax=Phakopsora pachyrhizi TaxID=170000 RepID=A0AAV0AQY5_PHAPC|nr:hypothetical protein PPACK8108_LOCUS5808 [Phakopsora pachyrhizi]
MTDSCSSVGKYSYPTIHFKHIIFFILFNYLSFSSSALHEIPEITNELTLHETQLLNAYENPELFTVPKPSAQPFSDGYIHHSLSPNHVTQPYASKSPEEFQHSLYPNPQHSIDFKHLLSEINPESVYYNPGSNELSTMTSLNSPNLSQEYFLDGKAEVPTQIETSLLHEPSDQYISSALYPWMGSFNDALSYQSAPENIQPMQNVHMIGTSSFNHRSKDTSPIRGRNSLSSAAQSQYSSLDNDFVSTARRIMEDVIEPSLNFLNEKQQHSSPPLEQNLLMEGAHSMDAVKVAKLYSAQDRMIKNQKLQTPGAFSGSSSGTTIRSTDNRGNLDSQNLRYLEAMDMHEKTQTNEFWSPEALDHNNRKSPSLKRKQIYMSTSEPTAKNIEYSVPLKTAVTPPNGDTITLKAQLNENLSSFYQTPSFSSHNDFVIKTIQKYYLENKKVIMDAINSETFAKDKVKFKSLNAVTFSKSKLQIYPELTSIDKYLVYLSNKMKYYGIPNYVLKSLLDWNFKKVAKIIPAEEEITIQKFWNVYFYFSRPETLPLRGSDSSNYGYDFYYREISLLLARKNLESLKLNRRLYYNHQKYDQKPFQTAINSIALVCGRIILLYKIFTPLYKEKDKELVWLKKNYGGRFDFTEQRVFPFGSFFDFLDDCALANFVELYASHKTVEPIL